MDAQMMTAIGTVITAIGIAIVTVMAQAQRRTLQQVERQGNSRDLESKRLVMVMSQRLAVATKNKGDIAVAEDARKVYEEAKISTENK